MFFWVCIFLFLMVGKPHHQTQKYSNSIIKIPTAP